MSLQNNFQRRNGSDYQSKNRAIQVTVVSRGNARALGQQAEHIEIIAHDVSTEPIRIFNIPHTEDIFQKLSDKAPHQDATLNLFEVFKAKTVSNLLEDGNKEKNGNKTSPARSEFHDQLLVADTDTMFLYL